MPPIKHKKAVTSSGVPARGHRKNATEVTSDSGEEFEDLAVEAEDRYVLNFSSSLILWYLDIFIFLTALMRQTCLRLETMKWKVKMMMN